MSIESGDELIKKYEHLLKEARKEFNTWKSLKDAKVIIDGEEYARRPLQPQNDIRQGDLLEVEEVGCDYEVGSGGPIHQVIKFKGIKEKLWVKRKE